MFHFNYNVTTLLYFRKQSPYCILVIIVPIMLKIYLLRECSFFIIIVGGGVESKSGSTRHVGQ
jgi:hypothetical protein